MSKVITKTELRLSYTNLLVPRAQSEDKPEVLTYSTALLIPKSDTATVDAIKAAIKEALDEGVVKKWGGKRPANLKNPLRDGDAERPDDEVYAGHYFINGKGPKGGKEAPILLAANGAKTTDPSVIYSGVYARVGIQFYPFDVSGNRGVACGITSVLSSEHGDPLGNTVTVESALADFGVTAPVSDASAAAAEFAEEGTAAAAPAEDEDVWGK